VLALIDCVEVQAFRKAVFTRPSGASIQIQAARRSYL
jgi:hypothetical protein